MSATVRSIATKFGTVVHFDPFDTFHPSNFHILKIQHGGGRRVEKSENRHISATV